jgi:tetratricopeptide (TPR) repeat protein
MANLGINYRDGGRLSEAIALLKQAWELARKDPRSRIRIDLANAYDRAGQFASSEPIYRETLKTERTDHEAASPQAAHALVDLGVNLLNQQKYADAEPLLREALETFRNRDGEASPHAVNVMAWLGLNLLKQQKYADAEPLLRACLRFREQKEPDNWTTFNTRSLFGGSLLGQKRYAESEPLLLAGYDGMKRREKKISLQSKIRVTEAIERLVQLYEATGKTDKADEWRRKLPAGKSAKPPETNKN